MYRVLEPNSPYDQAAASGLVLEITDSRAVRRYSPHTAHIPQGSRRMAACVSAVRCAPKNAQPPYRQQYFAYHSLGNLISKRHDRSGTAVWEQLSTGSGQAWNNQRTFSWHSRMACNGLGILSASGARVFWLGHWAWH